MLKKVFLAVLAAFAGMAAGGAHAYYAKDFFKVDGIAVSASSISSSEAKKQAMDSAKGKAFFIVLKRLLASDDVAGVTVPDSYQMDKFVQKYKLAGERTGQQSYSASIDVEINKGVMQEYLKGMGLPYASNAPPATLVVPIDEAGGDIFSSAFFGGFRAALGDAQALGSNIVPVVLPNARYADLDFSGGGIGKIRDEDMDGLSGVLSRSGAGNIIVAEISDIDGQYRKVSLTNKKNGEVVSFETNDADMKNVAVRAIYDMNDMYKRNPPGQDFGKSVSLVVPISGIADWLKVEKTLASISEVKGYSVQALKYNKAQVSLKYDYTLSSLVSALRRHGMAAEGRGGYLVVKR